MSGAVANIAKKIVPLFDRVLVQVNFSDLGAENHPGKISLLFEYFELFD